jgi:hypothetical protein
MDKINEVEERISIYEKLFEANDDLELDSIKKDMKTVKDSIESIRGYLRGKSGLKGIVRRSTSYNHIRNYAGYYISSGMAEPNSSQKIMAERVERMSAVIVEKVDAFLKEEWKPLQSEIEKLDFKLFEEIE